MEGAAGKSTTFIIVGKIREIISSLNSRGCSKKTICYY
jgi:hypothetical protein